MTATPLLHHASGHDPSHRASVGPRPLRQWLWLLALACAVTSLAFSFVAGWLSWEQQKQEYGASFLATSRAILSSADRELDQAIALARGLGASPSLKAGDLVAFDKQVRIALPLYGYALTVLDAASGRQLINTQLPEGTLPHLPITPGWLSPRTVSGSVTVKPLIRSRVTGQWITTVQVPISWSGKIDYVIDVLIPQPVFQGIMDQQHFPPSWRAVFLDQDWTIVAHLGGPEGWVGRTAVNRVEEPRNDAIHEARVINGNTMLWGRSYSSEYGWIASVGATVPALFWQAFGQIGLTALFTLVASGFAMGLCAVFILRLASPIRQIADGAGALARNEPVPLCSPLERFII